MYRIEIIFWSVAAALLLICCGAYAWGVLERQRDIAAFQRAKQATSIQIQTSVGVLPGSSQTAVIATPLREPSGRAVLALLRIPGIGLEVPVNYGTDEQVLRRGAGVIEDTALPGSDGNVAIAAHRDTHFRTLKDLVLGDLIELEMPDRTQKYIVTSLSVVEPADVHVLAETGQPVLTLVTCYPFYFVGNAPQRFIVRAEVVGASI